MSSQILLIISCFSLVYSNDIAEFSINENTSIVVSAQEQSWVHYAAADLKEDIYELTGNNLPVLGDIKDCSSSIIFIGTRGTLIIDDLIRQGHLSNNDFDGHESSVI